MREDYLGDSYDLVKRFWAEKLHAIAPLYAHPRFVPNHIHEAYQAVTSTPILVPESVPEGSFGILLDPDTGIPLHDPSKRTTTKHATLLFVVEVIETLQPKYVICFDQSFHREHDKKEQMQTKMEFLDKHGIVSFYYLSHAPFLFVTKTSKSLAEIRTRLMSVGIPKTRLELSAAQVP